MKLFDRLFRRKKAQEMDYTEEEKWENLSMKRDYMNLHDKYQREKYIKTCLEQIAEATKETENLEFEYNLVTAYLTDIEKIEAIPPETKAKIIECAKQITKLEDERVDCQGKINKMTDVQFQHMQCLEDDMPQGLEKLKETEEYQVKIKQDLNRLDGEKHAYHYRAGELNTILSNMRGMIAICIGSLLFCAVVLAILRFALLLDVRLGYFIVVAIAAIALTIVFMKHTEAQKELLKVQRSVNKIILLQNTVKIRYVNNTNLLDYLYMKYDVNSSNELKNLWNRYLAEKEQREQFEQVQSELEYHCGAILRMLRKYNIQDPNIWMHQAVALYDSKEMVEIRHGLIIRRQKLRKQMEYNAKIAHDAQDEVKSVAKLYPEYAKKILELVSDYEKALA